jgi:hypothetical protein
MTATLSVGHMMCLRHCPGVGDERQGLVWRLEPNVGYGYDRAMDQGT